jgi:large subunit ribosomal protein L29
MDIRDIRKMTDEQLLDAVEDQREALFNLRFQKASGQMEDTSTLRYAKRNMARLLTVQRERELAAALTEGEQEHAE